VITLSRRTGAVVAAAALTVAGLSAIAAGRQDRPGEPPWTATPPPAAVASPGDDTLTRGAMLPESAPRRVMVPALQVDTPVISLGLQPDGVLQVPADAATVGWYTGAPAPGALGPAVLAGHVNFNGADGAFARLAELRPGDEVRVARQDGSTAVFAITRVDRHPKDRFPTDAVYGPIDHAGLRLITCGGDFDDRTGHYADNVIAYAELKAAA
jgi:sortase (surface protein transpeptidase)